MATRTAATAAATADVTDEELPGVEPQTTTTKTKDFLARLLTNPTPGTSQATDFLGRSVVASDKDFLGRNLV